MNPVRPHRNFLGKTGIFCLCVILLSPSAQAIQSNSLPIQSISITGLKRTRISAVLHIIRIKQGDIWTKELRNLVERRLKNYGTFKNVSLKENVDDTGIHLAIYLEDRWTLFPFPVASSGSGSSIGLGVFERNFLGTQTTIGSIFLFKEKKPRFFVVYNAPHFLAWDWELVTLFGYQEERVVDFEKRRSNGGLQLRYRFDDFLSLQAGYSFAINRFEGDAILPQEGRTHTLSMELRYNRLFLDEDYSRGQSFRLSLEQELWFSDFDFTRAILDTELYFKAFARHTFAWQNRISLSRNAPYGYAFLLGGKGGFGTLPVKGYDDNQFVPSQVISGTLEYRIPFYTSGGFIISAVGFVDYAFFSDDVSEIFRSERITSFGPSIRIYLRKIAVPAFQLYGAYIPEQDRFVIGFMLGMGFR
jgi:outer membrane protein assembly factor BamA